MVNADVGPEAIVKDLSITITAPPQNITMPGGNVVTLHWTGDTGDIQVPQAQMPIDPNTNESTIFYQTCVDHEKMGIYYLNVTYTTPDHWSPFTEFDNGTRHSTMPDLSTSYEDESCKNLFPLLNVNYHGLYYLINFGWWETPVNFLCVPADYYRWVIFHCTTHTECSHTDTRYRVSRSATLFSSPPSTASGSSSQQQYGYTSNSTVNYSKSAVVWTSGVQFWTWHPLYNRDLVTTLERIRKMNWKRRWRS